MEIFLLKFMNPSKYRIQNKLNLLAIIVENPGISLEELIKYTQYKTITLLRDELEKLFMIGSYPYSPADYIEILYEGNRVAVKLPLQIDKTIGLTVEEWTSVLNLLVTEIRNPKLSNENKIIYTAIIEKLKPIIPFTDYFNNSEVRKIIEKAISENKKIKFSYKSWKNPKTEEKIVNPLLLFLANEEYLSAFYETIEEHRYFSLSKISDLVILDEHIDEKFLAITSDEHIQKFNEFVLNSSNSSVEAELLIDSSIEFNLSRHIDFQILSRESNQTKIIAKILEENWFLNLIKGFGEKIIILSPEELKLRMIEDIKNVPNPELKK
jgi:proteasome accessory factor C